MKRHQRLQVRARERHLQLAEALDPRAGQIRGDFDALLREVRIVRNIRRAAATRSKHKAIPTCGPERRRAKAHRQSGLCLGPADEGTGRCREAATDRTWCPAHIPPPPADDAETEQAPEGES